MNVNFTLFYLFSGEGNGSSEMINLNNSDDEVFKNYQDVFDALDIELVSPSESVVQNLIQFAQSYEYVDLGSEKGAEIILN